MENKEVYVLHKEQLNHKNDEADSLIYVNKDKIPEINSLHLISDNLNKRKWYKLIFWTISLSLVSSFLWLVSNTLLPFIIAFIFAYILQPLINSNHKIPKNIVINIIFVGFISSGILILALLLPALYKQISILTEKIPVYNYYIGNELLPNLITKFNSFDPEITNKIQESLKGFINNVFSLVLNTIDNVWDYTIATISIIIILLLVPIILFYFLRDWSILMSKINELIPIKEKQKIMQIISSINILLAAYIRGQLNICLLMSIYYTIGLSIIGLDLSILIGISTGFLLIIPLIGIFISFILSMLASYFAFGFNIKLIYILGLYIIGMLFEGYFLTPKIIGSKIGLHPLWIMFAVFASGSIFGFWGIFFAIPIAGIVKVFLNYGIHWYKSSAIYKA